MKNSTFHEAELSAGGRKYDFKVRRASNGSKYVVIKEIRKGNGGTRESQIMVFEDHFLSFIGSLAKAMSQRADAPHQRDPRSIDELKAEYPRAYDKWTSSEEDFLRLQYENGIPTEKISPILQRKKGAIRSRLEKLGLLPRQ